MSWELTKRYIGRQQKNHLHFYTLINQENVLLKTLLVIYPNNKKMGIFNEQSFDHPFAKGIQGAPGVGFSLTTDGNYDINKKRLTNVGAPSNNTDAATKKYVDDTSSGSTSTKRLTVDSNIDMKNTYRITNLSTPLDGKDPPTKDYVDNTFLDRDGSYPMKGNLNMDNNRIFNLPAPNGGNQPTPLAFTDLKYIHVAGTNKMTII